LTQLGSDLLSQGEDGVQARFELRRQAGETFAGVFGGTTMYDYRFRLPASFHALAGVKYWIQIEAWQSGFPGWSIAIGTGGDAYHFRCQHLTAGPDKGTPTGCWFTAPSGDTAFSLHTSAVTGLTSGRSPRRCSICLVW
jgi:hypothetical protein